ncbi:MAG: hypothetical protein IJ901_09005 [Bacteroidaceae bacterium]|nr:hypothetical protein [Bacteroidaceae bacterium]
MRQKTTLTLARRGMTLAGALTRRTAAMLALATLTSVTAWAQQNYNVISELTVNDGTSESYMVPIHCSYNDAWQSELLQPAADLTAMQGTDITSMTFYTKEDITFLTPKTYQVYLKEGVESFPSSTSVQFIGPTGTTTVYEGQLTVTLNTMTITFTTPFTYYGGNLLIGFKAANIQSNQSIHFYGKYSNGRHQTSNNYAGSFLPKTTFTFQPRDVTKDVNAATVSGLQKRYLWRDGSAIPISYGVTAADENQTPLTKGTHYTETIKKGDDVVSGGVKDRGDYTLNLTGIDPYNGTKTMEFTVANYINMLQTGSETVNVPEGVTSFHVYDDGGADGNAYYRTDATLTLNAPEGCLLRLTGNVTTAGDIYLNYFTVNDVNGTELCKVTNGSVGTCTSSKLTLHFKTYNGVINYPYEGLNLLVEVIESRFDISGTGTTPGITTSVGGSAVTENVQAGQEVMLTVNPAEGQLLTSLAVKDVNNNDVALSNSVLWYTGANTATFTMPNSDVTITPTFSTALNKEGGLFINMDHYAPENSPMTATIPSGVTSFSIYDDGGKDGKYHDYENRQYFNCYLVVTTPEGTAMNVSGTSQMGASAYSYVYDNQDNMIFSGAGNGTTVSSFSGATADNVLTVRADAYNGDVPAAGIDIDVTITSAYRPLSTYSDSEGITFAFSGDGVILEDGIYKAKAGSTVTVTMSSDFTLYRVTAQQQVGENSWNDIDIVWHGFLFKTATFTMPRSAVRVTTQRYSNNGSLREVDPGLMIPKNGTAEMTIPRDYDKFHVYDFAGKDGDVWGTFDGTLTLTAPAGKVFRLSSSSYVNVTAAKYLVISDADTDADLAGLMSNSTSLIDPAKVYATESKYLSNRINIHFYYHAGSGEANPYEGVNLLLEAVDYLNLNNNIANDLSGVINQTRNVRLQNRTLYKDGNWNTLCLPFSLSDTQIAASPLAGCTLMTLDVTQRNGFDPSDGTLYLSFKSATVIEAGVPYLVKWPSGGDDVSNPVFESVTITSTTAQAVVSTTTDLETVQMVGTYSPVSVAANDKSILFLGDDNTLYYSTIDRDIHSCRAYFSVPYINTHFEAKARNFALSFDGEKAAGILEVSAELKDKKDAWYSLDGVRLSRKPTQRGLYINNGKKVIIK